MVLRSSTWGVERPGVVLLPRDNPVYHVGGLEGGPACYSTKEEHHARRNRACDQGHSSLSANGWRELRRCRKPGWAIRSSTCGCATVVGSTRSSSIAAFS